MNHQSRPVNLESLLPLLPARETDTHKRDYGHVLVLGGDAGKGGAAMLAAEAALRVGAGLVSVATHAVHAATFLARRPELMVSAASDPDVINALMAQATVLVAGPGLGRGVWAEEMLHRALQAAAKSKLPVVLDADALNLLADGRLYDCREGNHRDARVHVERCQHGNPGMASGGMGDVLSGVIGGLLAQGLAPADATRLGVCVHSMAADICANESGMRGMLASDLFPILRRLLNP